MTTACRVNLESLCKEDEFQNVGLALERYLLNHATKEEKRNNIRPETALLKKAADSQIPQIYGDAYSRWAALCEEQKWLQVRASTAGPLAVGLGGASPLEVGLTIHRAYGVPRIPGSAIKGICKLVAATQQYDSEVLFGKLGAKGDVVFHDAWLIPGPNSAQPFHRDVITVHHQKYYGGQGDCWPTDFDDPTPVPFLVVRPGVQFLFAINCPDSTFRTFVVDMLEYALTTFGIGGKTNAGYGRFSHVDVMTPPPSPHNTTWREAVVVRISQPLQFDVTDPDGNVHPFKSNRANEINLKLKPEFRDKLKKRSGRPFTADITVEVFGDEITVLAIEPLEEAI